MGAMRWLLWCVMPAVVLLAGVAAAGALTGMPSSQFTRDPNVLLQAHPLTGMVSVYGILVWTASAAITLFTAQLVRRRHEPSWRFLLFGGLLTCWLLLDDAFLFHEWLFPEVLGVRTRFVFLAYIALTGWFLVRFAALIRRTEYWILAVALGCFALSVGLDVLPEAWFRRWDYLFLIEDSAKLLGIVAWFAYFVRVSVGMLETVPAPRPPPPSP